MKKILLFVLFTISAFAQSLPRSTPEAENVSSAQIANFIKAWENSEVHEPHSLMILRNGKVITEKWWSPFSSSLLHTMYSVSKSFTATGVGFLIQEGKLNLSDKVIQFFPEKLPVNLSDNLNKLSVRDLLIMSTGNSIEPVHIMAEDDWVKAFLQSDFKYEPGSRFMYNSPATFMLSAIVQRVSGQKLIDYLNPRLFKPLGIENIDWEESPDGINTGGWGLRLKTEDMAKFAQLFLQEGKWKGKQILNKSWIKEASSAQIMPTGPISDEVRINSDWHQGYGYQMWRNKTGSYRGDGAFGQNVIILPEYNAVVIQTGESSDLQGLLNLVWHELLPAFNKKSKANLPDTHIKPLAGIKKTIEGRFVFLNSNTYCKALELKIEDKVAQIGFETDSIKHVIPMGFGKWEISNTTMKGPYLVERGKNNRANILSHKVAASYAWENDSTLNIAVKYIENMHTEYITLKFDSEGDVEVSTRNIIRKTEKPLKAVKDYAQANAPRLIIRGDDMGYSHSGNMALLKSSLEGIQTSIEVIAPSPWFPEAVKILQENPGIDVGLHFSLSSEWDNIKWRPLTEAKTLRDNDGYFFPMIFKNNLYPGMSLSEQNFDLKDIESELRAQIELLRKYIPRISHISGHMACTIFDPKVKELVRKVAAEYQLPVVDSDAVKDFGIEYIWFDGRNKNNEERIESFISMLGKLEAGKTYVFLEHPGLDTDELRAIHHLGYENVAEDRQMVTNLFTSDKVKKAIYSKGIKLVSYKDVLK